MSVERDTEQGNRQDKGDSHARLALLRVTFVNTPDQRCCKQDDIDHYSGVERHSQSVDKQKFEPAAYFHDTRHNAVEHGCHEHHRTEKGKQ